MYVSDHSLAPNYKKIPEFLKYVTFVGPELDRVGHHRRLLNFTIGETMKTFPCETDYCIFESTTEYELKVRITKSDKNVVLSETERKI